jgi:hypothetical protein
VSPTAGQGISENRKYSFLCLDSNLTIQPMALSISLTLSWLPTYYFFNSAKFESVTSSIPVCVIGNEKSDVVLFWTFI